MTTSSPRIPPARGSQVTIREHRIPSAGSKPYIAVEGPDGKLWFCESGAAKIGRFDPDRGTFPEFDLPARNATPIGIALGADGNLWFAQKAINKIGRITPRGDIAEFALPTPNAGPDGMILGPDGNIWFSESEAGRIGRIAPDGRITEFADGITPGSKPLSIAVRDGALWFSEAAGNRIGRIAYRRQSHGVCDPEPRQPAARHGRASRRRHLVRRDLDQRARPHRSRRSHHRTSGADAERLAARRHGRADGDLWYTANSANKIGRMAPDGAVRGEYDIPTPASGAALHRRAQATAGCSSPGTMPGRSVKWS